MRVNCVDGQAGFISYLSCLHSWLGFLSLKVLVGKIHLLLSCHGWALGGKTHLRRGTTCCTKVGRNGEGQLLPYFPQGRTRKGLGWERLHHFLRWKKLSSELFPSDWQNLMGFLFSLKCHWDQIVDMHFFTFSCTISLSERSCQISIYFELLICNNNWNYNNNWYWNSHKE